MHYHLRMKKLLLGGLVVAVAFGATLLVLNLFVCGLAGALAIFSILKVAFAGGAS